MLAAHLSCLSLILATSLLPAAADPGSVVAGERVLVADGFEGESLDEKLAAAVATCPRAGTLCRGALVGAR